MEGRDLVGTAIGTGTSLVLVLVVLVVGRLLGGDPIEGASALLVVVGVFTATLFGGYVTGRNVGDRPITWGALSGLATFVVAQVTVSLVRGEAPNVVGAIVFAMLFSSLGAIGGFLPAVLGTAARPPEEPS
jgi:putative membrane protein (TIGR04086 family)